MIRCGKEPRSRADRSRWSKSTACPWKDKPANSPILVSVCIDCCSVRCFCVDRRVLPERAQRFVIVGCVGRDGKAFVLRARNGAAVLVVLPLRNLESCNAHRTQTWPDITRNNSEVFAGDAGCARFVEHDSQGTPGRLGSLPRCFPMLQSSRGTNCGNRAAGARTHFVPGEREKFTVTSGPPRKRVDPVKAENVIDPKEVKNLSNAANTLAPPIEIAGSHHVPAVERDAPILSPFLGKLDRP